MWCCHQKYTQDSFDVNLGGWRKQKMNKKEGAVWKGSTRRFLVYLEANGSVQCYVEVSRKRRIKAIKEDCVYNTLKAINVVVKIVKEAATIGKRLTKRRRLGHSEDKCWVKNPSLRPSQPSQKPKSKGKKKEASEIINAMDTFEFSNVGFERHYSDTEASETSINTQFDTMEL